MNNLKYGQRQAQASRHNLSALHVYVWPAHFPPTPSYISEGGERPTSKGGNCNTSEGGDNIKYHHNAAHNPSITLLEVISKSGRTISTAWLLNTLTKDL
jgi:hypothetical protein